MFRLKLLLREPRLRNPVVGNSGSPMGGQECFIERGGGWKTPKYLKALLACRNFASTCRQS